MKHKLLVAIALASLAATSTVFAASGMDGMDDSSAGMQNLAMDNTSNNSNALMQNPGMGDAGNNVASVSSGTTPSADSSGAAPNANDDMSADTATGDDDY